jgi:hypothetical protein
MDTRGRGNHVGWYCRALLYQPHHTQGDAVKFPKIGKAKLGAIGLIFAGIARVITALTGDSGVDVQGVIEGVGMLSGGSAVLGVRNKQDRSETAVTNAVQNAVRENA